VIGISPNAGATTMFTPRRVQPAADRRSPVVFVVDDDVSVRESLELLIRCAGLQAQTFASAGEFLASPRVDAPSCLVLDVSLPDLNGLDLQARVAGERSDMPIIMITGHADVPMSVRAMKAGAAEFMVKPFDVDEMLGAVRSAIARSDVALGDQAALRPLRERHASLSQRERQVMSLVVTGRLNKQIARELGISEITVKAHRGKVMRKMQVDSLAELVNVASRLRVGSGLSVLHGDVSAAAESTLSSAAQRPAATAAGGG
jgi:FixJ family two-component response regulator